jgi:hypothetical protein
MTQTKKMKNIKIHESAYAEHGNELTVADPSAAGRKARPFAQDDGALFLEGAAYWVFAGTT